MERAYWKMAFGLMLTLPLSGCGFPRNCHDPKATLATGLIVEDTSEWINKDNEPLVSCAELCAQVEPSPEDVLACEVVDTRVPEDGDLFEDGKTYWTAGGIGGADSAAHYEDELPPGATTIALNCTIVGGCD